MVNLDKTVGSTVISQKVIGWAIRAMGEEGIEGAQKAWQKCTAGRETLEDSCGTEDLEEEAVWVEANLTDVLNGNAKPLRVTAHSKR